jgi:hypothetical protein
MGTELDLGENDNKDIHLQTIPAEEVERLFDNAISSQ